MLRNTVAGISYYARLVSVTVFGMLIIMTAGTALIEAPSGNYTVLGMFPLPLIISGISLVVSALIHHHSTNTVLKVSVLSR